MRRFALGFFWLLGLSVLITPVFGQSYGSGLISPEQARRFGLERAWVTQIRVDPARGRIQHARIRVSRIHAKNIFEVTTKTGRRFVFSDRDLDLFGNPRGIDGAKKQANEKRQLLKTEGIEATIQERVVPDVTLYVITDQALIHALDAETGKTLWTTPIGNRRYPTVAPAISDNFVAVVNGSTVYVMKADDGQMVWSTKTVCFPVAGAVIADDVAFVPMLNGTVEGYDLKPDAHRWPEIYTGFGKIAHQPTVVGNRVLWGTGNGDVNAITARREGVRYRLKINTPIAGAITYAPPRQMFAVTKTGYLYSFDVTDGSLIWQFSTGMKSEQPASVVGNRVFVITKYGGTFCIDVKTGEEKWWASNMLKFVAATKNRVYGTTETGQMIVLNADTGALVGRIPTVLTDIMYINTTTDRIYVASTSGLVQCLHEIGAHWPTIHTSEAQQDGKPADSTKGTETKRDPFSGGAKPAAKPAPKADEDVDPFG